MTGKKALERLKADPDLVAKCGYWRYRWGNGQLQDKTAAGWQQSIMQIGRFERLDVTLCRPARKERDVFKEPKVGDVVRSDPFKIGLVGIEGGRSCVRLVDDRFVALGGGYGPPLAGEEVVTYTRAEFAARAKPPFNWQVVYRAKD